MDKFGYPSLSDDLFHHMTALLYKESGMTMKDHKKYLVMNRLSKFVGENKSYKTFEDYFEAVQADKSENMLVDFVNVLTTNFSFFFREELHFSFLKQYLIDKADKEPYIRIWSAACSTGEEPYSIAISCIQALPNLKNLDLKILATDISTRVLEIAKTGSYHYSKVRGHIEEKELHTFFNFDKEKNHFLIKESIKELISYRYLNIMEDYPFNKKFDIVFLRNILIYFDNREKEVVINKIYDYIKPGGHIILGLSESLVGIKNPFVSLKNSIYQKKE